jgi:hypothetical protein
MFAKVVRILGSSFDFKDKEAARSWFNQLRQMFLDMNSLEWGDRRFQEGRRQGPRPSSTSGSTGLDNEGRPHHRKPGVTP